jgi:hypothetical protein
LGEPEKGKLFSYSLGPRSCKELPQEQTIAKSVSELSRQVKSSSMKLLAFVLTGILLNSPVGLSLDEQRIDSFRIPTMTDLLRQARKAYKEKGIAYVAFAGARIVSDPVVFPFARVARRGRFQIREDCGVVNSNQPTSRL